MQSECEGPSEYDLLMNMLGYDGGDKSEADYLDGVGDKNEVKRSEAKLESRHDEDIDDGLTGESSPSNENGRSDIDSVECGSESAEAALEMDEMESSTPSNGQLICQRALSKLYYNRCVIFKIHLWSTLNKI